MKLETDGGKLKLVSAYKMIFFAWIIGIGGFFMLIFIPMILISIFSVMTGSEVMMNGEPVSGWRAFAPILMIFFLFPVAILFHAAMFGGVLTIGLLVYRQFRPIEVIETRPRKAE